MFYYDEAVVYPAAPTRGAAVVVQETMAHHRPAVWISDRYTASQGHAAQHQTCLSHLSRDVAYGAEISDDPVPWRLHLWLGSCLPWQRVTDLAPSTLSAKRCSLDGQLGAILTKPSSCAVTRELQARIGRARDQLLVFPDQPGRVAVSRVGDWRGGRKLRGRGIIRQLSPMPVSQFAL